MAIDLRNWSQLPGSTQDPNSCGIFVPAGSNLYGTTSATTPAEFPRDGVTGRPTALITFIRDFLCGYTYTDGVQVGHGWVDVFPATPFPAGKAGFKAISVPDVVAAQEYKYIILDVGVTLNSELRVILCTSITSPSVYGSVGGTSIGLKLPTTTAGQNTAADLNVWLGASARHFVMQTHSAGAYGVASHANSPILITELTRAIDDPVSAGYTKFGWTTPYQLLGSNNANFSMQNRSSGFTAISTLRGSAGALAYTFSAGQSGVQYAAPKQLSRIGLKSFASSVLVWECLADAYELCGWMYNCIMLSQALGVGIGDDIMIPVTAHSEFGNEKFYDPAGTLEPYWIIGTLLQTVSSTSNNCRLAIPK